MNVTRAGGLALMCKSGFGFAYSQLHKRSAEACGPLRLQFAMLCFSRYKWYQFIWIDESAVVCLRREFV
jgi:hypothetical protein